MTARARWENSGEYWANNTDSRAGGLVSLGIIRIADFFGNRHKALIILNDILDMTTSSKGNGGKPSKKRGKPSGGGRDNN